MKGKSEKIEMSWLSFLIVGLALLVVFSVPVSAASYGTIIEGLNEIGMPNGIPGSIGALTTQPEKIVFGDEDSQSAYYLPGDKPPIVMAREYEDYGRVISIGHEGYFTGSNIGRYDNLQLGLNSIKWLDKDETKKILFDWRSLQWGQDIYQNGLINSLRVEGYTVDVFDGEVEGDVSAEYLANYGIYMICTSWTSFTQGEIDAIVKYVQQDGGGLFLTGLGWSWVAYHPESTIDEYPMNVIATNFGMEFFDDIIQDPTNYDGDPSKPIFHLFYEEKELPDLTVSRNDIEFGWGGNDDSLRVGVEGMVDVDIHNEGNAAATDITVRFFDGDTQLEKDVTIPLISAGDVGHAYTDWTLGERNYINVIIDPPDIDHPSGKIPELREDNNRDSISIVLTGFYPPEEGFAFENSAWVESGGLSFGGWCLGMTAASCWYFLEGIPLPPPGDPCNHPDFFPSKKCGTSQLRGCPIIP
uniref:CARDB domain-containing protein n=1 Tax=Candidatus Methanophaga sp. ANME-1 ERB7 TaxID=2759913 RepID=A0A7G9ZCY9_9EURY|nr:hypothetical protein HJJEBIEG_00025 [Methanosarcinales archaeon ANME-1 ERB7]